MDSSIDKNNTPCVIENKTIYLIGIPPHINTVMNLKNHFSQFANDMNVKLSYNGDLGAAAITFVNHEMALAAFNDSKLILESQSIKKSFYPSHAVPTSKSTSSSLAPKHIGFECKVCGKILATQSSLEAHIEAKHTNVKCQICEKTFNSKQSYRNHYNAEHTSNEATANGEAEITPRTLTVQAALSDAESDEIQPTSTSTPQPLPAPTAASTTSLLPQSTAIPIATAAPTSSTTSTDSIPNSIKRKKENTNRDIADLPPNKCLKTHTEPDSSRGHVIITKPTVKFAFRSLKLQIIGLKREKAVALQEISELRTELSEANSRAVKAERIAARANGQTKRFFDFSKVKDGKLTKSKQELAQKEQELADKEQELSQKNQLLNLKLEDIANLKNNIKDKDASLADLNTLLAQQKQQITELETEMHRLRDIITGNDANHGAQMQSLVNILQERDGTIMQLQQWLHEEQSKFQQKKAYLEHRVREKELLLARLRVENIELNHKVERLRDRIKEKNKAISDQPFWMDVDPQIPRNT